MAIKPAAIAQIGDEIELTPNVHTWTRTGRDRTPVVARVIHVQTYAPYTHPLSPVRDDYVARQVVTAQGSRWAGHPRKGLYRGAEIRDVMPNGVSFEDPWAAPLPAHGAMPRFHIYANVEGWPEEGKDLGPFTSYEEAERILRATAETFGVNAALMLDGEILLEI